MTTFRELSEAWIASREHCSGSVGHIHFWVEQFDQQAMTEITEDDVDKALLELAGSTLLHAPPPPQCLSFAPNGR